jgi:hypothetical protein
MREFCYGDEILQILRSEFAGSLMERVSHNVKAGLTQHSHLNNLLAQPFLTFLARLTGELARMTLGKFDITLPGYGNLIFGQCGVWK